MMLYGMVQELIKSETLSKPLQADKFMEASNKKIRSKQLLEEERQKEEESAEKDAKKTLKTTMKSRAGKDNASQAATQEEQEEEKDAMQQVETMMDVEHVKIALQKMTDVEQEMYLRQGLDVVQLGTHVSHNLEATVKILQGRIDDLRAAATADPGNAAYYLQQIIPIKVKKRRIEHQVEGLKFGFQSGYSLYIFAPLSPIRVACCRIAFHRWTNWIVMVLIFFSCFTVAMDRPSLSISDKILLGTVSSFVNFLFFLEAVLKIIGLNFEVYISAPFNKLDFLILLTSLVDEGLRYLVIGDSVAMLMALRVMRSLRILRLLSRVKGLALMLRTIFTAIRPIVAANCVSMFVCFLFGLLGLQLLAGKMHYCTDPLVHREEECVGEELSGSATRQWLNEPSNFDWIGRAVSTVYTVSTGADWNRIMFAAIDATDVGKGPSRNYWPSLGLYFVVLIFLGRYLIITLMTAILVDAFEKSNIKAQILAKDAAQEDAWQVRGQGKPKRANLPKVENMFDEDRLENDTKRAKLNTLWNALHLRHLRLSDLIQADEHHPGNHHHSILDLGHNAVEAFHHATEAVQHAAHHASEVIHHAADSALHALHLDHRVMHRPKSAESVANAVGHGKGLSQGPSKTYPGIDYLGTIWHYTTAQGSWRPRRAYHTRTILMLCGLEAKSVRPSAADVFARVESAEAANAASEGGGQQQGVADAQEEILEFALVPGANLELVHQKVGRKYEMCSWFCLGVVCKLSNIE